MIRSAASALVAACVVSVMQWARAKFLDFGKDFIFGVVQDSYQFEGSLGAAGAGQSNLDLWVNLAFVCVVPV